MNVRDILKLYGVSPDRIPIEGPATPLVDALEAYGALRFSAGLAAPTAIEEMERVPDLADWVAAVWRSGLGTPHVADDAYGAYFAVIFPASGDGVEVAIVDGPISGLEGTVWAGKGHAHYATPAELRAALDALAGGGA